MPALRASLYEPADRPGYAQLRLGIGEVKPYILGHAEFAALRTQVTERFTQWRQASASTLATYSEGSHPKALIAAIAEHLLDTFKPVPLLNAYAVFQHLMDYWAATMQDDAYAIAADGWVAKPVRVVETDKKGRSRDKGWKCDLVPKALVVARWFKAEQAALDAVQAEFDAVSATLAELEEEHGGEDGALGTLEKLGAKEVRARLKEIAGDADAVEERNALQRWVELSEQEAVLKRSVREQDAALDRLAFEKYATIDEVDVRSLVVDDKWMAYLSAVVQGELDRVSQRLTGRIRELADRYASPLPRLVEDVENLSARVEAHLAKMGASWT